MAGVDEVKAVLQSWIDRAPAAATAGAGAMAVVAMAAVQEELGKSSHARGTPTTSAPGSPPALVTGQLRRSVVMKPAGPGHVQVGASTFYARIQELGGTAGRNHAATLPARPYLLPAIKRVAASGALTKAAAAVIAKILTG